MVDSPVQVPQAPQTLQPPIPQVVQGGGKGISWGKIILTVIIIVVVTAIIGGALWYFVSNKTSDEDLSGSIKVGKRQTPATGSATPSATATGSAEATKSATTSANQ